MRRTQKNCIYSDELSYGHCEGVCLALFCKRSKKGDVAIFFGYQERPNNPCAGPQQSIIGDDEPVGATNGVFNYEAVVMQK
jgi:ATP-dependent phosphoenolpyruvate carboxykinase